MCDALCPRYRKEPEQMSPAVMGVMQKLLGPIGLISRTIHGLGTGALKDPIDDGQLSLPLSLGDRAIPMAVVRQELKVRNGMCELWQRTSQPGISGMALYTVKLWNAVP